jgi:hypothetical protein
MQNLLKLLVVAGACGATVFVAADTWGPIDVKVDVQELYITHDETVLHNQAVMSVKNAESRPVDCTVVFRNGPELPVARQSPILPGEEKLFSAPIRRDITRLLIDLKCQVAE